MPRTSPYRCARASAGSASIRCTTSASRAARWARASSSSCSPSGSSASSARSTAAVSATRFPVSVTSASFAVAAVRTVVPHTAASITARASSGRQEDCQVSRKVPRPATSLSAGVAQPSSSTRSRWNSTERCWSMGLRRSRSCSFTPASRFSRSRRQLAIRSASSGTVGTPGSTRPVACPTTSSSVTNLSAVSSPSQRTARVASVTSASPASGRRRSPASVSASRTASITAALETGRSRVRRAPATLVSQRVTGRSGAVQRW